VEPLLCGREVVPVTHVSNQEYLMGLHVQCGIPVMSHATGNDSLRCAAPAAGPSVLVERVVRENNLNVWGLSD
jgi:hypothetical protein